MKAPSKALTVDLKICNHDNLTKIAIKTGESKVEIINRLVEEEALKRESPIGIISDNSKYDEVIKISNEILQLVSKSNRNSETIIDAINRVYCGLLFTIKELFRLIHWNNNFLSRSKLHSKDELIIIDKDTQLESLKSFNNTCKVLEQMKPIEIVDSLKKN